MSERGCPPIRAEDGFTLLEVLVALSVFSLAVIAHLALQTENIRTVTALEEQAMAQIVAENVLAEAMGLPEELEVGVIKAEAPMGGRDWTWTRRVQPTDNEAIVRIEISVRPAGGGTTRETAFVTGFRRLR